MKLEVPIKVDIDDVTKLIHDLQCLQTYKLGENDTTVLVSLDAVADVFADHIRAKRLGKETNVPTKDDTIPVDWIQRYINVCEAVSKTCCGTALKLSAEAVSVMLDYWREEQNVQKSD